MPEFAEDFGGAHHGFVVGGAHGEGSPVVVEGRHWVTCNDGLLFSGSVSLRLIQGVPKKERCECE